MSEEVKVPKQTPAKLYMTVPHRKTIGEKVVSSQVLLSCDKIKAFEGVLPTEEILQTHFQKERVLLEIAKEKGEEYTPQPLYLEFEPETFNAIIKEASAKSIGVPKNIIVLTLGAGLPCCIISMQQEKTEEVESLKTNEQND